MGKDRMLAHVPLRNFVRKLCKVRGLETQQVAAALGVSEFVLSQLLCGRVRPTPTVLIQDSLTEWFYLNEEEQRALRHALRNVN